MENNYIITTTNYNKTYYEFLPSVYNMWKKYYPNGKFILGFIDDMSEKNEEFIEKLKNNCDVFVKFDTIDGINSGVLSKINRMWLASQYDENICSVVDIDQYLLNIEWFKNKIKESRKNKFVAIGHNMYLNTPFEGKFAMSYTTAKSNIWKRIVNYNNLSYNDWIKWNGNIKDPIDNKENIKNPFNRFSDESLLRYYIEKNPDRKFIEDVLCKEDREDGKLLLCEKRVDRSKWWKFDINLLNSGYYIDSQPLRPFNSNIEKLKPILRFIGIKDKNLII